MSKELGEIFAERVESWFNSRNLKQVDLAKRLEMEPKALSKVLSEKRLPRDLLRWARALNVSIGYLLGEDIESADASDDELRLEAIRLVLSIGRREDILDAQIALRKFASPISYGSATASKKSKPPTG